MRALFLCLGLASISPLLHAQPLLRVPNVTAAGDGPFETSSQEAEQEEQLLLELLDLDHLLAPALPPSPSNDSGWGGALLPDPNYRVPEHERLYPPGYLERKGQHERGATQ